MAFIPFHTRRGRLPTMRQASCSRGLAAAHLEDVRAKIADLRAMERVLG